MKAFMVVAAMVALIAAPAHAQMGGGKRHQADDKKTDTPAKRAFVLFFEVDPVPLQRHQHRCQKHPTHN